MRRPTSGRCRLPSARRSHTRTAPPGLSETPPCRMVWGQTSPHGLRYVAFGTMAGILVGVPATIIAQNVVPGARTSDPIPFIVAMASVLIAVAVAAWLPARRAGRVQPAAALRYERETCSSCGSNHGQETAHVCACAAEKTGATGGNGEAPSTQEIRGGRQGHKQGCGIDRCRRAGPRRRAGQAATEAQAATRLALPRMLHPAPSGRYN
jgi:hypothetical protein